MKRLFLRTCKSMALVSLTAFMLVSQFSTTVYATENIDKEQKIIVDERVTVPAQDDVVVRQQVQPAQSTVPGENTVPAQSTVPGENTVPAQSIVPGKETVPTRSTV